MQARRLRNGNLYVTDAQQQNLEETTLNNGSYMLVRLADFTLNEQEAVSALVQAASTNGYVAKDGIEETMNSLYSGLTSGKAKPRPLPSQKYAEESVILRANLEAQRRITTTSQTSPMKRSVDVR